MQKYLKGDRVNTSDNPASAFEEVGYRLMAMRLMRLSLLDLLSSDQAIKDSATNWFKFGCAEPNAVALISYEDCVGLVGLASKTKEIREIALSGNSNTIEHMIKQFERQTETAQSVSRERQTPRVREQAVSSLEAANHLTMVFR